MSSEIRSSDRFPFFSYSNFHLHGFISRLEVEGSHLRSNVPHRDRVVVRRIDSLGFWVDPTQLDYVVPEEHLAEFDFRQVGHHHLLGERRHLVRDPLLHILVSE